MKRLLYFVCATALWASVAMSQTLGDISGIVSDTSGAVIAKAKVVLTNKGTGATREVESNEAGLYAFPALTPGFYDIKVTANGFKTTVQSNVELQVQQSLRQDFDLQVGQVSESIEVSGQAAALTTENATVGTVIENKRIVELPLNGRNYLQLVSLAPNVSFGFPSAGQAGARQGGVRADQSISVAGQRSQFNRYTLDGVENTDPNFNTFVVLPSVDALQEFKVQSGIYPAEFGRGATQINTSTKPGTNEYHGTLFHFLRNEVLDAKNYAFTAARPPKDPFKWNQFGFTLGGPVSIPKLFNGKNRLFFMTNYEWFRQRRNVQAVYTVPTDALRGGDFSSLPLGTTGIFDPASRPAPNSTQPALPFPNNVIPTTRFAAQSRTLLEFLPSPNVPGAGLRNNFVRAQGRPINRDQFVGRFDFVESSKSQWFGRYSWGDENQLAEALVQNGNKIVTNFNQYMVSNTRIFSNSVVNEFRFGLTQFYNTTGPELAFTRNVVGQLNIPGLAAGPPVQWGIPGISLDAYTFFGNDSEGPYENNNRAMQFINNLSWVKGKHTFKFGGEIRNDQYNQVGNQFARGNFTFIRNATRNPAVSAVTGDPFAEFLLGQVFQAEAAVSIANARFRATGYAFYVDDVWKITPKVTLNYGLRYENNPPWTDQTGTLFNGIVPNDINPGRVPNAQGNLNAPRETWPFFMRQAPARQNCYEGVNIRWPDITVRCDGSLGSRLVNMDNNDWAPRIGLTWAPTEKWVIRMGFGTFYSQDTGNPRFDMSRNLAGRLRDNADTKYLTWQNSLSSIAGGTANVFRPYTFANPVDRRTPYTNQWTVNLQRELGFNTVFEIGYLGSNSRRLEQLRAANESVPACRAVPSNVNDPNYRRCFSDPLTGLSLAARSPFPNFGRIQLVDNGGFGNYHSLGTKLTKRYSNGMTYLMSYTWSRSMDTGSAIRNQGGDTLFPQNSYCRLCEYGPSSHDVRHRFVTSALYDLPFGKGRRFAIQNGFANALIGGWQIGNIITWQSGFPLTVTQGGDPSNTGGFFDRPMATGISPFSGFNQTPSTWFNTAAFSRTPDGMFGNVGRNTMRSPGIVSWDFSTMKNFNFTEAKYLQFRFEAFNFPNHPILGNPDTNIISPTFGGIFGTRTNMRNLQVALKLVF